MELQIRELALCAARAIHNSTELKQEIAFFYEQKNEILNATDNVFSIVAIATWSNRKAFEIQIKNEYHKVIDASDVKKVSGINRLTEKALLDWLHTKEGTRYLIDTPYFEIMEVE